AAAESSLVLRRQKHRKAARGPQGRPVLHVRHEDGAVVLWRSPLLGVEYAWKETDADGHHGHVCFDFREHHHLKENRTPAVAFTVWLRSSRSLDSERTAPTMARRGVTG